MEKPGSTPSPAFGRTTNPSSPASSPAVTRSTATRKRSPTAHAVCGVAATHVTDAEELAKTDATKTAI
jgi:hypothetical protein